MIETVATASDVPKATASKVLEAFFEAVKDTLVAGDEVALVGFGTFNVKERAARMGRNPKTGDEIQIAASRVPSFKAGKALKDSVNQQAEVV